MKILVACIVAAVVAAPALKRDVGEPTYGLASSGGSVWVGGLGSGDVLRIDPASGKVLARVSIGARAFNLAAARGAVWGIANLTNTAARIDTRTGKVTASVPVGNGPYDIEWGFGSAWVSNSLDGTVSRITGKKVVKTIKVGVEPNGIAAIGNYLWVTDHTAGKLLRLDPRTNRVTGQVPLSGADWVTGSRGSLYVSQETNVVTRVDARTLKVLGRVNGASQPARLGDRVGRPVGAVHRLERHRRGRPDDDEGREDDSCRPRPDRRAAGRGSHIGSRTRPGPRSGVCRYFVRGPDRLSGSLPDSRVDDVPDQPFAGSHAGWGYEQPAYHVFKYLRHFARHRSGTGHGGFGIYRSPSRYPARIHRKGGSARLANGRH